jgi:hypothetical protein
MIPEATYKGVEVDRDGPDTTGGYKWRITFLDQSSTTKNWELYIADNKLVSFFSSPFLLSPSLLFIFPFFFPPFQSTENGIWQRAEHHDLSA